MERKTLLLLAILAGANAGPLSKVRVFEDDNKCSSVCPESSKFKYEKGTTYEFSYDSSTITALTGASEEVSGLHITATADVEVLDQCEFALKLRDVRLEEVDPRNPERRLGAPGSTDFRRMLEAETLRFSFQDGKVAELCPSDSENWQALNVKRGVLSAFQNSMDRLTEDKKITETDVAGNCEAHYKVKSNSWGKIMVSKEKKILGCTDRHGKLTSFQAMPYRVPSTIQSMPLMKSHHNCEQSFHTDGRLIETNCEESHVFRAFSYGKSGAQTTVRQNLKYKTYRRGTSTRQSTVGRRTDLLFEHAFEGERMERDYRDVVAQLRDICSVAKDDVRPEVPRMFANLVYKMRRLNTESLNNVWRQISDDRRPFCSNTKLVRKYFLDAVPACGTVASVSLIQRMISRDDVTGSLATLWLNSLAFITRPSKQMLAEVKPLVNVAKPSRQAMLTVSALVHSYCRLNGKCADDVEVQDLLKIFEDNLGYDCKINNKDERQKILMSLKALGNTGRALKAVETLGRCADNKKLETDIRVAAIQAFRRMPCSFDKTKLKSIFKDSEEDTEIRAHAYLAFMRCASKDDIMEVKSVLENEKSTQIGTFIWTHLTNLMETADPFKWQIREIIEDEELSKEFNNDLRKFSRNYEKSFFSQILNTGAKVESNILFSSKSYIPRSGSLNLTLDVFGESLNLLEVEGRVEGFEYMVESFFGPNGYFQQNEVNSILNRKRRNVINNADVQKAHTKFGAQMDGVTKGSGSVKIFGNEIAFGEFIGFDPMNNKDSFNPLDLLIKLASDQDIDFSKSAMFIDTSMIVPTMIGLPLNLTVNGTASVNLKLGGHVDIRKLMTSPHNFDIDGHIKPSGAVEISSVMAVDAFVAKSGVKMVSTVHSSTFLDGKMTMKNGEFNFNLNTPKEKMEIFDVESKFFIIHKEQDREQKMITDNRVEKKECTGDFLTKVLGVQLCGELQFPNAMSKSGAPFYPLTGPSKLSVVLLKSDSHKGYNFQAKYAATKERKAGETHTKYEARLAFNTPGSRINRNIALDYELNLGDLSSKFELNSPWKKVTMDGSVSSRTDLKRATIRITMDEESEYFLSTQLENEMKGKMLKFSPTIELRIPKREPITLSGFVEFQHKKHYAAELTLSKLFRHPVTFKSNADTTLSSSQTKVIGDIELRNQLFDSKLSLNFNMKPGKTVATRIELEYNRDGKPKQNFLLSKKIRNLKPGAYSVSTLTTSDAYPEYNHQLGMELNYNNKHVDFEIDMNYGDDFSDKNKNIFINHNTDFITKLPVKIESKSKLKVPGQDLLATYDLTYNVKTMLDHAMTLEGRWNNKKLDTAFNVKDESTRRLMKYSADGRVQAGKFDVSFDEKFEQTSPKAYSHDLTVTYAKKSYSMLSTYSQEGEKTHAMSTSLVIPGEEEISATGTTTLDLNNFGVSGTAKFRGESYSADGSFKNGRVEKSVSGNANIQGDRYSTEGKVTKLSNGYSASGELNLKGKRFATEGKFEELPKGYSASGELNLKGQRYTTEGKVEKLSNGYSASGELNLKGQRYTTEGKVVKQSEGWKADSKVMLPGKSYSAEGEYSFNPRLMTTKGSVNVNGDKYSAEGKVENEESRKTGFVSTSLKGKVYSAEAKYNKNGREITGELDLASPWRRIETDANLSGTIPSAMRGQVTVSWDAGRDASKKMTVTGSYSNNSDRSAYKHVANLRLNHPGHVGSFDVNFDSSDKSTVSAQWNRHRIAGNGEFKLRKYSSGLFVNGEFGLTSTFDNLGNLAVDFKHRCRGTSYTSGGSFSWAENKKVGGDFTLEIPSNYDIKTSLTVNTPFRKWRNVNLMWNHKLEDKSINAQAKGTADARNYEITVTGTDKGSARRPTYEGSVNVKSPFKVVEDVTVTLNHMHDSRQIDSKVEATLAPGKVVSLSVNGQDRSRVGRNIRGTIALASPWRDLSASVDHNDDAATTLDTKLGAQWDSDKKIDVTVNLQNKGTSSRDMEGTITVKTPFEDYTDLSLTASHKDDLRQFDTALSTRRGRQEIAGFKFNMRHYARNWRISNNGKLDITTPFLYYRTINYDWNHRSTDSNVNTNMNIKWPSNKRITLTVNGDHNVGSRRTITANLGLKTPFEPVQDIGFTLNHDNGDRDFTLTSTIKLDASESIVLNADLKNTNAKDLTANFKLLTPFIEDISSTVKVMTTASPMTAHADFSWAPRTTVAMDGSLNLGNGFNGDLRLTTPFEKFERFVLTARHEDNNDAVYKSGATFEYAPRKKFDLSSEINLNGKYGVNLDFKIPCPEMRTIVFNLDHSGDLSEFTNKMDFESQPRLGKFTTDVSLKTGRNFEAKATVTTPFTGFEEYSTSVTHTTRRNRMVTNANVNWPRRQTIQLNSDLSLRALTDFTGAISLSTPFPYVEMTTLNFNHKGDLSGLNSHVDTEFMRGQKVSADVSFTNEEEMTGTATLNLPITNWERTQVGFTHKGELKDFTSSANVEYGRNKKIMTTVSLDAKDARRIDAAFGLNTPFENFEDISLSYKHNGDWTRRFRCEYEIGYAKNKKIELTHTTDLRRDITVEATFKSPFEKFEEITASFKHAGPIGDFKTTAEVTYAPRNTVSGEVNFNMQRNIEGGVKFTSPFEKFEKIEASFRHGGVLKKFESHAEVSYAPRSKVEGDVTFDMTNDITGSVSVKTPFEMFENTMASFRHSGEMKKFNSHAEVSYLRGNKVEGDVAFDMTNDISGSVTVKTPFEDFENTMASFRHSGPITNFNSHAEVNYFGGDKIEGDVTFAMTRNIAGSVTVKTPFENFENTMASFRHSGELKKFESHAEVSYAGDNKVEGDVTFDMTKDIVGSVAVKTPFRNFEDVSASFKHEGRLTNFKTHAETTYAPKKKVEADFSFNMEREIEVTTGFKSPFKNFEDITAGFKHTGNLKNLKTEFNVQYSPRDKIDVDVTFKNNKKVLTAGINARTPFRNYRRQEAFFRLRDGKLEADVTYNGNQKLDLEVMMPEWTDITATLKTPYSGFEQLGAVFKLTGDYSKTGHAEVTYMTGKKIEADLTHMYRYGRSNYRLDSSLVIKTPFRGYNEVGAKATYNGYPMRFNAHMDVYCPSKKYELDVENDLATELNKKSIVTIKTPHQNFEELSWSMKLDGTMTNFNKHTEIVYYRDMKITNDVTFKKMGDSIEATYAHTSPYWDDFSANYKYNGEPTDFTSHLDFSYKAGETIESDIAFSMKNAISATASLKTPFENFEDMSINVVHKGRSWRSMSTSAVVKYSPHDSVSASTTFSLYNTRLLANMEFTSPFRNFEYLKADITHDGDLSAFNTNAEVSYARGKKISTSAAVKIGSNADGTFTLKTPFQNFKNIELMLKNRKNGEEHKSTGTFTWAHGKSVNVESTFQNSGEFFRRKDVKFHVTATNTHRRDLSLSWKLDHSHMWKRSINSQAVVNVNGKDYADVTAIYRRGRSEHRGSLELAKPYPMKAEASGAIDGGKVNGEVALNWNTASRDSNVRLTLETNNQGTESQIKRDSMLKIITAYRTVIVEHNIEISPKIVKNNIVYCWDDARDKKIAYEFVMTNTNGVTTSNKITTPWRSVKVTTDGKMNKRRNDLEVSLFWDADRENSKKLTLKGKHERFGNTMKQELVIQHPNLTPDITIQNEVNIGDANTIYSTNTEIDYSGDSRKKLTVSTNLRKESVRFSGTNYTMKVDITHPASSLDFSTIAQFGDSARFLSAGIGMDYMTAKSRSKKSFLLRTEINKLRNEVELELLSPSISLYNWGKMRDMSTKKYTNIHLEMKHTYNTKTVSSSMDIDQKQRLVDLKVNYDPENPLNLLHAYAKFNNDSAVTAEVYRMRNNAKITEGLVAARLNNSRLLHSRVHWRPSLVFDIKDGYYAVKEQLHPEGTMMSDMAEEFNDRVRRTQYMYKVETDKIIKKLALKDEMLSFDNDWNMFTGEMGNMLRRNEFYTRDMMNAGIWLYNNADEKIELLTRKVSEMANAAEERLRNCVDKIEASMTAYWTEMTAKFDQMVVKAEAKYDELRMQGEKAMNELKEQTALYIEQAVIEISQFMEPYMVKYMDAYNSASEKMAAYMEIVNAKYAEVMKKVYASSAYAKLMDKVEQVLEKYDAVISHDYAQYLPEMPEMPEMPEIDYTSYYNNAQDFISDKAQQYTSAIYGAHSQLNGQITDFLQRAEIQALKKYANIAVDHGKWAYENYEIERHAKSIAKNVYHEAKEYVEDNAKYIAKEYLRLDDTRVTVWEPKQGEIQVEVGLPVEWESFVTMPKYEKLMDEVKMLRKKLRLPQFNMTEFDQNAIMDYFYQYKPTRDYLNWIPPFKAHAMISGQHIMTFDHRHYEFQGTCSYVLAHDFIDGNFTVLVDYHAKRGKSLIVLTNEKEVQLLPDFTVRLNGKKIDMPVQFGNTTVMRIGNAIRVHNTNGVTVTCDNVHDVCTTNMTGWYYGKTAGLFGTYDNEPSNDFLTMKKSQADDTLEFTRSWSLRCRGHRNNANINKPDTTTEAHRSCAALFETESSVLRPCFKIVNPSDFYMKCYNDLSSSKKNDDDETLACNVAASYIKECSVQDVYLRLPRKCVKCATGDKKVKNVIEGEEFTFSKDSLKVPKSADVVIVVEQKLDNKKVAKRLQDIVKNIEVSLRKNGIKNNMFGLVGFGGEGVHDYEHSHTMDGQLLNTFRLFKMGVNTLEFSKGTNNDVIRAIRMATLYPFRAGVSKTIVVVPSSACDEVSVKYSEIQQLLIENGIQLHVVAPHDFSVKGKKSYNYYGIDANAVYTNKDYKKYGGEAKLRKYISVPKDLCVALAHETNGSVFNLNIITKAKTNVLKKMITVFSRRVAQTATPNPCQVCQCTADELGVGKSICRSCELPSFTDYFSKIMRNKIQESGDGERDVIERKPTKVEDPGKPKRKTKKVKA